MAITTTPNRVKKGGYWCEDADEITQKALDACGLDWDTEIPVVWGLDNLGLANTFLGLGSPLPRYKLLAERVTLSYLMYLYQRAIDLCNTVGYTVEDVGQYIGNPKRVGARKGHYTLWTQVKFSESNVGKQHLCEAMRLIYSEHPLHLTAIHAGKELLAAARIIVGPETAKDLHNSLANKLRVELERT